MFVLVTMDLNKLPSAITQIVYLTVPADTTLEDDASEAGKSWSQALDVVEESIGYQKLYWGRSVEQPQKVQLHIGKFKDESRSATPSIAVLFYSILPHRTELL